MDRKDFEILWNYYYGLGKTKIIWSEEIKELISKNKIRKVFEVIDEEFDEVWYMIKDNKDRRYIVKNKQGDIYARDIMKQYRYKYRFNKIDIEVIKLFANKFYPIVYKVNEEQFTRNYDIRKNKNYAFYNLYYTFTGNYYKGIREFRNKLEYTTFTNEEDMIMWCKEFDINKSEIKERSDKPMNLLNYVYDITWI